MGNSQSTVDPDLKPIVTKTELSELYIACSNNDIELAQALLETTPYEEINTHEINGSTALHRAVEAGHTDLVRLLLRDYEVSRHRLDNQGHTAFELAQTDQMQQFFRRPADAVSRCFSDTMSSEQCTFVTSTANDQRLPPSGRVDGQPYFLDLRRFHMDHVCPYYGSSRRPKLKISQEKWIHQRRDILLTVVNESIFSGNPILPKVKELLRAYGQDGRPEHLIRLFTLESPFYSAINQNKSSSEQLAEPIYNALPFLIKRAYKGEAYRGLALTKEDIDAYRWAKKVSSRVLIFNTFASMTKDYEYAKGVAMTRADPPRLPVVMIFTFSKKCLTAIQLERLSPLLPPITEIESEKEVLILPRTAFYVTNIEDGSPGCEKKIYLEHCSWLDREVEEYYEEFARAVSVF